MRFKLFHSMMRKAIQKTNRRCFTLLEILLCFVILGMISGVVLSWGSSLVQYHQFRHSVQGLTSRLALCRQVAVCYQTDVVVVIKKMEKNSVELSCTTLDRIQPLEGLLYKKKIYHGITRMLVDEQEIENIRIQFFSTVCLQEKLTLYSSKNEKINIDVRNLLISTS